MERAMKKMDKRIEQLEYPLETPTKINESSQGTRSTSSKSEEIRTLE